MTGTIDLNDPDANDGEVALIEENGEWSVYLRSDIEEKSDGSWGPVAGAEPSGALNAGALNAGELLVSEQSSVDAYLSTDQSYSTADGYVTVEFDATNTDNLGEFDVATHQFTPAETGLYSVTATVHLKIAASGDSFLVKFENVSSNSDVMEVQSAAATSNTHGVSLSAMRELTGGDAYDVQITNLNNDDTILGLERRTYLNIYRLPVG